MFLFVSSLFASDARDKWARFPYVQKKLDEIKQIMGRPHGENNLFAVFKIEKSKLIQKCVYGPTMLGLYNQINQDNDGFEIIDSQAIDQVAEVEKIEKEIERYLFDPSAPKLSKFEMDRIIKKCRKCPEGCNISEFHKPRTESEKSEIAKYCEEATYKYFMEVARDARQYLNK